MANILYSLSKFQLPPSLISIPQLNHALREVKDELIRRESPMSPITDPDDLYKYYTLPLTSCLKVKDTLIVTLTVPLVYMPATFDIYEVISFGTPIPSNTPNEPRSQPGHTRLDPAQTPSHLAVSATGDYFVTLSAVEASDCILSQDGWCPCLLYTSPSPRDGLLSRMPSSA